MDLLVIGHVARDRIGDETHLGGAASFGARAAAILGLRTALVTAAPGRFAEFAPLADHPNISVHRVATEYATTFELDYSGVKRRVRLLRRAPDLDAQHIPAAWRSIPFAYVAPVCGECRRSLVDSLNAGSIVAGAQGWLRATSPSGEMIPKIADEAARPPRRLAALVLSELDHPDAEQIAERWAKRTPMVAITRGEHGATLLAGGRRIQIPAEPAEEVDPTGAGDVFTLVLGLALHCGAEAREAGQVAACAAARVVEGPGLGRLVDFRTSPAWRRIIRTWRG
jgi:hypothetical protein